MGNLRVQCPKMTRGAGSRAKEWYSFLNTSKHAVCGAAGEVSVESIDVKSVVVISVNMEGADAIECMGTIEKEVLSCEWQREPEDVCTWKVEMQAASVTTQVK